MKKLFSFIAAVLFAGSMMAGEVTVSKSVHDLFPDDANGTQEATLFSDSYISISVNADGNNGKIYGTGTEWRLYHSNNAVVTVAATNATIKSVAFEFTVGKNGVLLFGETQLESENAVTVNAASAEFTVDGGETGKTNGQVIIKGFTVVYETEGGVTPPEPACKWDEIAFLGNGSGVAAYTDRFKVCTGDPAPTAVVNIQSPDWAAEPGIYLNFPSSEWGAISLAEDQYKIQGAGILLYVSAFLYDAETEVTIVCQEVTYTLTVKNVSPDEKPVAKKTCAEVYELADNAEATLNDVTVTYASGANVWVKDASGALLVYLPNGVENSFKAGDVLAGVAGAKATYKGLVELKPADAAAVAAIVATAGVAPAPEELTAIDADKDMSKLVLLKGVEADGAFAEGTASNLTITLGENTYTLRNNFKNAFTFDAEKKYDVTAIVTYFNALQLYFISAEEASTTAIENTVVSEKAIKMFENGQLVIIKNGVRYNAQGQIVK